MALLLHSLNPYTNCLFRRKDAIYPLFKTTNTLDVAFKRSRIIYIGQLSQQK